MNAHTSHPGEITQAIARLQQGLPEAARLLLSASYGELKRLAHSRLWAANQAGDMATESLVHETYLRLSRLHELAIPDRQHFFAYASKVMRSIILDSVREAHAQRRGAGQEAVTLSTDLINDHPAPLDVQAVNDALQDLERVNPDLAQLVELRFFGGLTEPEVAQALGKSERTVRREWVKARAALLVLLES